MFMNYAVEMGSDTMIYVLSFLKTGSGIQKLMGGGGLIRAKRGSYEKEVVKTGIRSNCLGIKSGDGHSGYFLTN
jgi:hypothetical protein